MYTTQRQVRKAFWDAVKRGEFNSELNITSRKITNYSGNGHMHNTATRCTFVDFVDSLDRGGELAEGLAERVTL